jgi:hypothetical protein
MARITIKDEYERAFEMPMDALESMGRRHPSPGHAAGARGFHGGDGLILDGEASTDQSCIQDWKDGNFPLCNEEVP